MPIDPRTLALIKQRLEEAERNIQYVRQALSHLGVNACAYIPMLGGYY